MGREPEARKGTKGTTTKVSRDPCRDCRLRERDWGRLKGDQKQAKGTKGTTKKVSRDPCRGTAGFEKGTGAD
jgi:hypothetical protein